MVSTRSSSTARRMRAVGMGATIVAAVAGMGLSLSGQGPREWRDYAGGPDSSRFVAATQITKANVSQLQVAWTYPAGQTDFNPLVVRGVVYGRGANDSFVALDAATGKEIWIHEGVQGYNVRGVNYWESKDGKDRRLIFSVGNMLQEIDAQTGKSISSFGTDGQVDLRVGLDRDPATINQQSRTPGRVFENLIIMGSATNQEYASAPGDIRAFDVRTGQAGLDVSHRAAARRVRLRDLADGRVEDRRRRQQLGRAVDRREARHRLRADRAARSTTSTAATAKGANLFGDCLIALDARTGKRLWHFQTVHHDIWDLDNNSAPQLTTIRRNGRQHRRRRGGEQDRLPLRLRSRHRRADLADRGASGADSGPTVPGEALWPTQPFPTSPPPFSRQKFTADDLESVHPHAGGARAVQAAHPEGEKRRAVHADRVRRSRSTCRAIRADRTGAARPRNPADGSVYVIGFNVPTIIRLLKPGEMRPGRGGGRAGGRDRGRVRDRTASGSIRRSSIRRTRR